MHHNDNGSATNGRPTTTNVCRVCGIGVRYLSIPEAWVHAEGRTLANNLHNNTPDHDAAVTS